MQTDLQLRKLHNNTIASNQVIILIGKAIKRVTSSLHVNVINSVRIKALCERNKAENRMQK